MKFEFNVPCERLHESAWSCLCHKAAKADLPDSGDEPVTGVVTGGAVAGVAGVVNGGVEVVGAEVLDGGVIVVGAEEGDPVQQEQGFINPGNL